MEIQIAQAEAPQFERVSWTKEPHLRKLYAYCCVLMIASATTGYDGMLVNTSQQMDFWNDYFPETTNANKLGILINMFNIGSIISLFITPYVADRWGRKIAITIGCLFMVLGGCLTAFTDSYGSKFCFKFWFDGCKETETVSSVHRWSILARFRKQFRTTVLTSPAHRDLPSSAPWSCDCRLQLSLELGSPLRFVHRMGNCQYQERLVLEINHIHPNRSLGYSAHVHLLDPRVSPLPTFQGSWRRSYSNARHVPCWR
jgi:hypothetical protein